MANTHLQQVLKTVGLPDDQIKALNDLPEDAKDFKPDPYVTPINTAAETKLKNDPKFYEGLNKENLPAEFMKKLQGEVYGAEAGKVRHHMLKATGLSEKDFAELGEDFKKMEVFTPAFVKKLSEGKVTDKELQAKLIEANQQIEELKGLEPKIAEKYKTEFETKTTEFKIAQSVLNILASVPGLKVQPKYLSDNVINDLKSKYSFALENGVVELRQKDKPTLKALNTNNTKELTLADAITSLLDADNLIDKKTVTTTTTNLEVNTGKGGLKVSQHVNDKMQKLMADEKKAG